MNTTSIDLKKANIKSSKSVFNNARHINYNKKYIKSLVKTFETNKHKMTYDEIKGFENFLLSLKIENNGKKEKEPNLTKKTYLCECCDIFVESKKYKKHIKHKYHLQNK